LISTFLDPNFGISAFEPNFQNTVKSKIIALTKISKAKQTALNPIENSEVSKTFGEVLFLHIFSQSHFKTFVFKNAPRMSSPL
jgi:hypothetical protein